MLVGRPTRPVADVKSSAANQVPSSPPSAGGADGRAHERQHSRNILGPRSKVHPTKAELSIVARQKHFPASTRQHSNPDRLTGCDASQLLRSSGD